VALNANLQSLVITEQNFELQRSYAAAEGAVRALDGASRLKQKRMNMGGAPDKLTCRNKGLMVNSFTFFFVASQGFSYLREQLAARCCGDSAVTAAGSRSKNKLQAASEATAAAHSQARAPSHNSKFAGPSFSSS
jgi:hypothetical protein